MTRSSGSSSVVALWKCEKLMSELIRFYSSFYIMRVISQNKDISIGRVFFVVKEMSCLLVLTL